LVGTLAEIKERPVDYGVTNVGYVLVGAHDACGGTAIKPPGTVVIFGSRGGEVDGYPSDSLDVRDPRFPVCTASRDCGRALGRRLWFFVSPSRENSDGREVYWDEDTSLPMFNGTRLGWAIDEDDQGLAHITPTVGWPLVERAIIPFDMFERALTFLSNNSAAEVANACSSLACLGEDQCLWGVGCGRIDILGPPDPCRQWCEPLLGDAGQPLARPDAGPLMTPER
jgi:hypothetical protein